MTDEQEQDHWVVPAPDERRRARRERVFRRLRAINEQRGGSLFPHEDVEQPLRDSAAAIEVAECAYGRELPDWTKPRWPRDGWEPRVRESDGGLDVILHVTIRADESATVWGWVFADEGKRIGTWQDDWKYPAWTVALEHLRPPEELLQLLAMWDRRAT